MPQPRRHVAEPGRAGRRRTDEQRRDEHVEGGRDCEQRQIEDEPKGRLGLGVAAAVTETSAITSDARIAPSPMPPITPNVATSSARSRRWARIVAGDAPCASRSNSSPRSSRTSPTTESSNPTSASSSATAAVPASVSSDTARQRISAQLGERVGPRLHRQLRERRLRERRRGGRFAARRHVHPELVGRAEPGRARVEDRRGVRAIRDDDVAVHGREALDRADDARRDLLPLDLQRDDPARAGLGDHARRREDGQRHAVGRLPRPEDAVLVRREDVAEPRRRRRDAAGPDPAGERRARRACRSRGPRRSVTSPFALGCRPSPPFADRRPLFRMSSRSWASVAPMNGMRPCSTVVVAPFVWPSETAS